jgi:outer membrane protein assembly factor BamE (lipoprotein component of BamABCDE complex)
MYKALLATILLFLFTGCLEPKPNQMAKNFSKVKMGMTKLQLRIAMGEPKSVNFEHDTETITYHLCEKIGNYKVDHKCLLWNNYEVKLVDGKVVSFGLEN